MNSLPIILRFCSGSDTPASLFKKRSLASILMRLRDILRVNVSITPSASPLRKRPWSINMQYRFLPIALSNKAATTDESTPPDNASNTLSSPTCALISSICWFTKSFIVQLFSALAMLNTKFLNISSPYSELRTSGWNCNV